MGSSKKRKEKAKDFAKAKLKLGKGKQKAANATDTSFSSRSIALGQQSIGKEHKDAPTTKRNLTLEELSTQLKHYSAGTRKDALAGLKELLSAFPELVYSTVSVLVPLLARIVGDEEASVRKALLSFLTWYLPSVPSLLLQPQHSILVFFTTSALSHIYPDVRLDAVRMLNILLEVCPECMVLDWNKLNAPSTSTNEQNHSQRVLECYLALLHIRSGVVSNGLKTDMSPASKALVLSSLAKFIRLSVAPEGAVSREEMAEQALPEVPTWYMAASFATQRDYEAFEASFSLELDDDLVSNYGLHYQDTPTQLDGFQVSQTPMDDDADIFSLGSISACPEELLTQATTHESFSDGLPRESETLLHVLLPILLAAFLDTAPSAFSPSLSTAASASASADVPLETVIAVAELARDLWRSVLARRTYTDTTPDKSLNALSKGLEKFVGHMAAYFPFGGDSLGTRSAVVESKLQNLNIVYCELVSLLYLASSRRDAPTSKRRHREESSVEVSSRLTNQMGYVSKFVSSLLSGSKTDALRTATLPLNSHLYVELLPTLWTLLLCVPLATAQNENSGIFEIVVKHFMTLPASSGVKKVAFEFISRTIMAQDQPAYTASFTLRPRMISKERAAILDDLHVSLPRYLWELGASDLRMTQLVFLHLRRLIASNALTSAAHSKVCAFMAPYFLSQHAAKGIVYGPWAKLQSIDAQEAALETAWWLRSSEGGGDSEKLIQALQGAVKVSKQGELKQFWKKLAACT